MVSSPATTTASIESECVIPQSKPMSAEVRLYYYRDNEYCVTPRRNTSVWLY